MRLAFIILVTPLDYKSNKNTWMIFASLKKACVARKLYLIMTRKTIAMRRRLVL